MLNISQDEREHAIFRSRRMYQTDLASNLATAEDNGRLDGMRKGMREMKLITARMMLSDGKPVEEIMRYTGLSAVEIQKLKQT